MVGLILIVLTCFVGQSFTESCKDLALQASSQHSKPNDRMFLFKTHRADPYLIYCDFEPGHGYTYLSTTSFQPIYVKDHDLDKSDFKVRLLYSNGSQYETTVSRPGELRHTHVMYTDESPNGELINSRMLPYMTVTMQSRRGSVNSRSYLVNGERVVKEMCDVASDRPHNRLMFAFLFNHGHVEPRNESEIIRDVPTAFLRKWVDMATEVSFEKRLPRNFFSFFEVLFKNCGGAMTMEDFPDIIGAALGLKYGIFCGDPPSVEEAKKHVTGRRYKDTVTYTCLEGYELYKDIATLTCSELGEWLGEVPRCILVKPRSCFDHVRMNGASVSGVYIVFDMENEPYTVHCDFYQKYIYTFITPTGMKNETMKMHRNDDSVVVVRACLTDGRQVESELTQLSSYKDIPIRITTSSSSFSVTFLDRNDNLGPRYSYINHGYKVNGESQVETEYSRSYYSGINVKYSINLRDPDLRKGNQRLNPQMTSWLDDARSLPGKRYMPQSHFYSFTLYFGNNQVSEFGFDNLYGITIGFRYNME